MQFTTRPTLEGTFGMVSSTHWIASQVAMRALELGGNAFDAAVTGAFVLHLVEPHLNGPGGDLTAIVAPRDGSPATVLCGQGVAPEAATIDRFRTEGLALIPGSGPLAAAVPGAVDAWLLLLRDHGSMTLEEVLAPTIGYARAGHPLSDRVRDTIAAVRDLFADDWPTSAAVWLPGGKVPPEGALFRRPAYAATLERLVRESQNGGGSREQQIDRARLAWREGFVAAAIDEFAQQPTRTRGGPPRLGLVTGSDVASWQASWEAPVTLDWRGWTVTKVGPWSQGPALLQTLAMLDVQDPSDVPNPVAAEGIHRIVESFKLALADREAWYGDGFDTPMPTLLSAAYARERSGLIATTASRELRPGSPDGRAPALPTTDLIAPVDGRPGTDATTGEPTVADDGATRGDTCHIDVVDKWGNMISATPSGGWLQSAPMIPELGFCLGSRLQMFWLEEGLASSLRPGLRPRTTLTPTLVQRDGEAVLACGSPGGDQQDQWQLTFLLRTLGLGQSLQEAIDAPNWHSVSFPESFWPRTMEPGGLVIEDRVPADVRDRLAAMGHDIRLAGSWSLGRLCAVRRDPESGLLSAGANPRAMHGYAVGR